MTRRSGPTAFVLLVAVLAIGNASAATICVGTSGELSGALTVAALNNEADIIRLEAGTYIAAAAGGFSGNPADRDLEISGGWVPGCLYRRRGVRSTIDGQYQRPGLIIYDQLANAATVRVAHMSFLRGVGEDGGGLTVSATGVGELTVEIEDCRFHDNHLGEVNEYPGGGLRVGARNIYVLGNVFSENHADYGGGAGYLQCSGALGALTGNTVVANTAQFGTATSRGGLLLGGNCLWEIANNILWDNEGYDLKLPSSDAVLRYNDIDDLDGTPAAGSVGNVNVDPQFVSAGILRLKRSSPLIDAGFNDTLLGQPAYSHDGGPRLVGERVDIGAYELDVLFEHDFDPAFGN